MRRRINSFLVGIYILLCIVFGGSAQGIWSNLGLELLGIGLLSWAAIAPQETDARRSVAIPALMACALLIILAQLAPLPPAGWAHLPGRKEITDGFAALGYPVPAFSISENPYRSVATLFAAIPATATLLATDKLRPSPRAIVAAVVIGLLLATLVGVIQVGGGAQSWAYFYPVTNPGAVGFFANRNHMATLLLVAIPLVAAVSASSRSNRQLAFSKEAVALALFAVITIGIVLNSSLAAYGLVMPVALASASLHPALVSWRRLAILIAGLFLILAIVVLITKPIATVEATSTSPDSIATRTTVWHTTIVAIRESTPVGTGLGSFEQVYRQHENPRSVTRFYVNHAHNDYLELTLELGIAGAILIIAFLIWWGITSARIWKSPLSTAYHRAATICTAIILAHSIVDFPLRTAAISAIFAACIGIMMQHLQILPAAKSGELRPSRHIKLG